MRTRSIAALAIVAALGVSCRAQTPIPSESPSPTPSPTTSPTPRQALSVVCSETPTPVGADPLVAGVVDTALDELVTAIGGRQVTVSSRAALGNSSERKSWREQVLADSLRGDVVVVIQAGNYQRESAATFVTGGARIVLVLPMDARLSEVTKGYPTATMFIVTTAKSEADAALSAETAAEVAGILTGTTVCAPLSGIAPSAAPSPTPTASATTSASKCGPSGARRTIRFAVEIDSGIAITPAQLRKFLKGVYCDMRGWLRAGVVSFEPVTKRTTGVTYIRLLNRAGVKKHCGRLLGDPSAASGNYSCASYAYNEIVLNNERWQNGAPEFNAAGGTLTQYRTMVATHEMGHVLDLRHQNCTTNGGDAPVMMQQSITMTSSSTGKTCKPNPWPLQHEIDRLRKRWS